MRRSARPCGTITRSVIFTPKTAPVAAARPFPLSSMRNLNAMITSLRSALLCASAAFIFVGCGSDDEKEKNPNPATTQGTGTGDASTGDGSGADTKKKLGDSCAEASECESNICREYNVDDPTNEGQKLTGKSCSSCNANAECTDPAVGSLCAPALIELNPSTLHYVCSKGALGDGCLDNSNCSEGRICGKLLGLNISTCGECATKDDCKDPAKPICSLKREGATAYNACTDKLADGQPCSGKEGSDEECQNYCAKIPNIPLDAGVCSPCSEDSHCADGQTCTEPKVDIASQALTPSKCEAKEEEGTTGAETGTGTGTDTATSTETKTGDTTT